MSWYVTEPFDLEKNRADMSLGLRNSVWFYNNAPCPGVGNVFHPRLFTLALLGIHISKAVGAHPILVGNAIEALAMKYTFLHSKEFHMRGVLAFKRSNEGLSFSFLSKQSNYVTNTYRQNTSRYLNTEFGLDLVSGNVFSNYELKNAAIEIISALDRAGGRVNSLKSWVTNKNSTLKTNFMWLRFGELEQIEKDIYSDILQTDLPRVSFFENYKSIRKEIYSLLDDVEPEKIEKEFSCNRHINILKTSRQFLKIRRLLDLEINKAGKKLSNSNASCDYDSMSDVDFNTIKNEIEVFLQSYGLSELTARQKSFSNDSSSLFKIILGSETPSDCLKIILNQAKDFFNCERKYSRGIFYKTNSFKNEIGEHNNTPYSIMNLKRMKEVLDG